MPFDWLKPNLSTSLASRQQSALLNMRRGELREKAALLRRLGYGQAEALRRLRGYVHGEYEPFHNSPLAAELDAIVESVYGAKLARVGTLSPGA